MHFQNFHNATIVIQRIRNLRYDVRIHMYIHTYIQTPLAFNTLMWGSLRLAPISKETNFRFTHKCGARCARPNLYIYGTCVFRIYILPYLCVMQHFHISWCCKLGEYSTLWGEREGVVWCITVFHSTVCLFPLAYISHNNSLVPRSSPPPTVANR